jgi:DNA-binding CsgD family transcriptional regulator/predicted negative regulator of RcsB-dependent stress response
MAGRSATLRNLGRLAEAADDGRRALALAREIDYPAGEALALEHLAITALYTDDLDSALQLARQIPANIPGWLARLRSILLAEVLIEAGDLAGAERTCAAELARCRDAGDVQNLAELLIRMANLDLQAGRTETAAAHLREALQTAVRTGSRLSVFNDLDCCGDLCAATGRRAEAVTIWAAEAALSRHEGYREPPAGERLRRERLREAWQAVGPAQLRAAEERGAAMSLATAAEYALMLTDPGSPQPAAPVPGALSARERELVTLVARGRTDAQIVGELYISIRTVRSHLDRIRDKTGCRRRADLTRLALNAELV